MAVYTLEDYQKSLDPQNRIARQVRLLSQANDVINDVPFLEGNLDTGHQVVAETGLPEVAYKMLNAGVVPSVGNQVQYVEQCGKAVAWMKLDRDLANRGGNAPAYRMSKWPKYMEALNQVYANRIFYGNVGSEPAAFTGLSTRYSSLSAGNAQNVIDAGGTGSDNASIWLIAWGEDSCCGIYPKGSTIGLTHYDHGLQLDDNTNGVSQAHNMFYVDEWQWDHGLCLTDWRYVVRICNIDISNLLDNSSAADLIDHMEHAEELLPNSYGTRVFYMNRTVKRFLRKQYRTDVTSGGGLTYENVAGKPTLVFGSTPVRIVDQLVNTESRVT